MKTVLSRWVIANRTILTNAGALVSTTGVTSVLGFVYWWVAARQFPQAAVGLASAAISAMGLLGGVSVLGLGTLLMGELQRQPGKRASLITTALIVSGTAGGVLGLVFALVAPSLSADLQPLGASLWAMLLFALGVSVTAVALVIDQALIGLLRGGSQFWRNALFAAAKLAALWLASIWIANQSGLVIWATWVVGIPISFAFLAIFAVRANIPLRAYQPDWSLLRHLRRAALGHHALNLVLQGPILGLPVLVTVQLSASTNAHFYAAWMIAYLVFMVPVSLTTVLYAVSAAQPEALARQIRHTLQMSGAVGLLANMVVLLGADLLLGVFGPAYAAEAGWTLRILALGVFPLIVRSHYIAIARIHKKVNETARYMAGGALLELAFAALGAAVGGLTGLSIGWVAAVCVEAMFMALPVYRAASPDRPRAEHNILALLLKRALR